MDRKKAREQSSRSQPVLCGGGVGGRSLPSPWLPRSAAVWCYVTVTCGRGQLAAAVDTTTLARPRRDCITPDAATLLSLSETSRCGKTEIIFSRKAGVPIYFSLKVTLPPTDFSEPTFFA